MSALVSLCFCESCRMGEQLDRDMPPELLVGGIIDGSHAALTQSADDLIVPEQSAEGHLAHFNILPVSAGCGKQFLSARRRTRGRNNFEPA